MSNPDDSMELVEIVARAMCAADGFVWEKQFSPMTNANGADSPESYLDAARAALTAIEASGRRIVPVELTTAMVNAYVDAVVMDDKGPRPLTEVAPERWAAFLSASPKVTP